MDQLYKLGEEFKPSHLVLPDRVNDYKQTMENAIKYLDNYKSDNLKYIGVCQGETFDHIADCIDFYIEKGIDIIALPFDLVPDSDYLTVRYRFLNWWYSTTSRTKRAGIYKFHLLGCQNPVEFQLYNNSPVKKYIYSLDTSSPIVNGWSGNELGAHGLTKPKPKDKLADNLDISLSSEQLDLIFKNVKTFRTYVTE